MLKLFVELSELILQYPDISHYKQGNEVHRRSIKNTKKCINSAKFKKFKNSPSFIENKNNFLG